MPTKPWYTSKTVWGGVVAVVAGIGGLFGAATLSADQQTEIVNGVMAIASGVGGLIAVYGRLTAKHTIG